METNTSHPIRAWFQKWGLVVVLSLALVIIIFDTTMLNVSIRNVVHDLGTSLRNVQWAITIYSLVMAAFMLTGGRIGDMYGRKKLFLIGVVVYATGTITAALSPNVNVLILGWSIIEGIGAALMMPATVSLILANYRGRDLRIAFGIWGGTAGATAALGPLFGGYMTTHFSWRWAFATEVIIVIVILALARYIRDPRTHDASREKLDYLGAILSAFGLGSVVFGLLEASQYGWWKAKEIYSMGDIAIHPFDLSITPIAVALGVLILIFFGFWQRRLHRSQRADGLVPLMNPVILQNRAFSTGIVTLTILVLAQSGIFFTIPVLLQAILGLSAFDTGLALMPMSIALFIAAGLFSRFTGRFHARYIIQLGILISFISAFVLKSEFSVDMSQWDLIPGLALYGFGFGLIMSQITNLTLATIPLQFSGQASGLNTTFRTVGQALGTAIIGTILLSSLLSHVETGVQDLVNIPEAMKPQLIEAIEEQARTFGNAEPGDTSNIPAELLPQLSRLQYEAIVDSNKDVMNYAAAFTLLTLIASFFLPRDAEHEEMAAAGASLTDPVAEPK
ncbi:MAG: MFS transporter [Candidatus Nomurabacteria bacterium]|nr:MAG: MFS transporter [Candidatus Nomurabacteria bacterium]